jgi:hypothetical protein
LRRKPTRNALTLWLRPTLLVLALLVAVSPGHSARADSLMESLGDLPPGEEVIVVFRATLTQPLGVPGASEVSNQATVSGSNFASVLTDDPDVGGAADPTVTPLPEPSSLLALTSGVGFLCLLERRRRSLAQSIAAA